MTDSVARFRAEQLTSQHLRGAFSCGVEAHNRYLQQQATQDIRRNLAVAYVLVETATGVIAGYYTLSSFSIVLAGLPESETRKLPRYGQVPGILIGRLARDRRFRGQGVGELLLIDALRRAFNLSKDIGAWAVIVDAKDDNARLFYERFGFLPLIDNERRLFLPMRSVEHVV
jgi:GNAT superfamily N-acetyltransferase